MPAVKRRVALTAALAAALVVVLAGCGSGKHPYDATAENNGYYVKAGPLSYQLQVSRVLNPYAVEDRQYVTGLPPGTPALSPDEVWFGVFLWAKNTTEQPQQSADSFYIQDTAGNKYYPVALDHSLNPYAWTAQTLQPLGTEPGPDTTAYFGPTQGGLVLFKLNTSVYGNRPLTLFLQAPGAKQPSTISLDL